MAQVQFFIVAEKYTLVCMSSQQYNNEIFHSRKHPYYLHGQIENTPLPLQTSHRGLPFPGHLGPVVQGWVSANPALKLNLLFWFVYLYASISFKTSKTKITIHPDKISGKIFQIV